MFVGVSVIFVYDERIFGFVYVDSHSAFGMDGAKVQ